ncbi:MAG: hypothetical protein R2856_12345 [Caldilineaceae bacterium]
MNGWLARHPRGGEIADKHAFLTDDGGVRFPATSATTGTPSRKCLSIRRGRSAPGCSSDDPVTLARRDPAAWRMIYAILRQVTAILPDAPLIVVFRKARMIGPRCRLDSG